MAVLFVIARFPFIFVNDNLFCFSVLYNAGSYGSSCYVSTDFQTLVAYSKNVIKGNAMVVGRFVGKEALACVGGSSSQIINLIVGFFIGLSSGATVIIAQYYGA